METEGIPDKQYFKIGEVSALTKLEPYVLRYWETEFKMIRPVRFGSNQRMYRRKDVETILEIKKLLYDEGFTIAGARKKLLQNSKKEKEIPSQHRRPKDQGCRWSDAPAPGNPKGPHRPGSIP